MAYASWSEDAWVDLTIMRDLMEAGKVPPVIDRRYRLGLTRHQPRTAQKTMIHAGLAGVSTEVRFGDSPDGGRRVGHLALNHFARTDAEPVLVEISGSGPTDTRYVDPANAPKTPQGQ